MESVNLGLRVKAPSMGLSGNCQREFQNEDISKGLRIEGISICLSMEQTAWMSEYELSTRVIDW
jgi:hypothetical protein